MKSSAYTNSTVIRVPKEVVVLKRLIRSIKNSKADKNLEEHKTTLHDPIWRKDKLTKTNFYYR
jgi:hypothetical protein